MKLLVFGSRDWDDLQFMCSVIDREVGRMWNGADRITLIHGAAPGADTLAGKIGKSCGFRVRAYPADWNRFNKGAGPERNQHMLDVEHRGKFWKRPIDFALGFATHGDSRGTFDMSKRLFKAAISYMVYFK